MQVLEPKRVNSVQPAPCLKLQSVFLEVNKSRGLFRKDIFSRQKENSFPGWVCFPGQVLDRMCISDFDLFVEIYMTQCRHGSV